MPAIVRSGCRRFAPVLLILASGLLTLGGCATAPAGFGEEPNDPIENVNRAVYSFNSGVDRYFLRPLAKGYKFVTPDIAETGVNNFFMNLGTPLEAANSLLQGKPGDAGASFGRFLVNSTLGVGGLIDVATMGGIERRQEDFAQTLATWGVPSGPYLMLPFVGPSTPRGLVGFQAETFGDPLFNRGWRYQNASVRDKLFIARLIALRARLVGADDQVTSAYDPYAFLRSAYTQRRDFLIYDGDPPEEEFDDDYFDDDPGDGE